MYSWTSASGTYSLTAIAQGDTLLSLNEESIALQHAQQPRLLGALLQYMRQTHMPCNDLAPLARHFDDISDVHEFSPQRVLRDERIPPLSSAGSPYDVHGANFCARYEIRIGNNNDLVIAQIPELTPRIRFFPADIVPAIRGLHAFSRQGQSVPTDYLEHIIDYYLKLEI